MSLIQPKQIDKIQAAPIRLNGKTVTNGSGSVLITTELTTALNTAGNGGVAVPLQVSADVHTIGLITSGVTNMTLLWATTSGEKLIDAGGNELYGRLTESGGVYTLTFYSLIAGVETAYSFTADTDIDFVVHYRFDFERLPADHGVSVRSNFVNQDPGAAGGGASLLTELRNPTGTNTLPDLTKTPDSNSNVLLLVNGVVETTHGNAAFSVSGKTLTWNAANAGYTLETTDVVVAQYTTNE